MPHETVICKGGCGKRTSHASGVCVDCGGENLVPKHKFSDFNREAQARGEGIPTIPHWVSDKRWHEEETACHGGDIYGD